MPEEFDLDNAPTDPAEKRGGPPIEINPIPDVDRGPSNPTRDEIGPPTEIPPL